MMTTSLIPLLIAKTMMSDVSLKFREDKIEPGGISTIWFITILLIAIGIAVLIYWMFNQHQSLEHAPGKLFADLTRVHGLNRFTKSLLQRIADQSGLAQPSELFLAPEIFDRSLAKACETQPLTVSEQACVNVTRERLFAAE